MAETMAVIMTTSISGSRGDEIWPPAGGRLVCGEAEARHLIRIGLAVEDPAGWPPPAPETTDMPEDGVEVRAEPAQAAAGVAKPYKDPFDAGPLEDVAPRRRGPGRPRKDSLPE
jgi:hypothetical protein